MYNFKMSVHFSELSRKFFEHFFKLATKTETIEPFYTDNVTTVFDFSKSGGEIFKFQTKKETLSQMSSLLPLHPETSHSFSAQPYQNGKTIIIATASSENSTPKKIFSMTFVLDEVDKETHRFGITHQILMEI